MSNKTNIIFFLPRFHTNLLGLTSGLVNAGCRVHIYTLRKYLIEDYSVIKPILIPKMKFFTNKKEYFSGEALKMFDFPSVRFIYTKLKELSNAFIVIRVENSMFSITCIAVSILMLKKNVLLYSQRAFPEKNYLIKIFQFILYYLLGWKSFTPVLTNDFSKKNKYNKWIPFAIFNSSTNIKKKWRTEPLQITTISKLTKRKNIDLVIEAFKSIKLSSIRLNLIVVITNEYHQEIYKKNIKNLESYQNIFIYKNIKYSKVQGILKNSHIFILLSEKEPASISNLEAMAYGNALILGEDNGTANYINTKGGYVVDYNLSNIILLLNNLVNNKGLLKKMGTYNIQKVKNDFDAQKITKNFLEYLSQ
jgi:glycosyltransferase involved in cell wall biosynthesis